MPSESNSPLQPNPFTTYRDPQTGLWIVAKASDPCYGKERSTSESLPYNLSTTQQSATMSQGIYKVL